jgi:hypothetical protein
MISTCKLINHVALTELSQVIEIDNTSHSAFLVFAQCMYGASVKDVVTEDNIMVGRSNVNINQTV